MSYRADEEARLQRIEMLEKELGRAREAHAVATARERESESEKDELEKRIETLEKDLAEARREPPPPPDDRPTPTVQARPPKPPLLERIKERLGCLFSAAIGVVIVGGIVSAIQDCRGSCKAVDNNVDLRWPAEVVSASGVNVRAGTRCVVRTLFFADRDGQAHLEESEVTIDCNGRVLFDGHGDAGCAVAQARAGERWRYRVPNCSFNDDDGRSVHWVGPDVRISSASPTWEISVRVPPEAEARAYLYDPDELSARLSEGLVVIGDVIVLSGAPPVEIGSRCQIRIEPWSAYERDENCHVSVQCGELTLRRTEAVCEARGGRPVSAEANGVDVDIDRGTARVYEQGGPGEPYAASIQLSEREK